MDSRHNDCESRYRLVRERITDRILPPQSVSQYDNTKKQTGERTRIIEKLTRFLEETR